MNEKLQPTDYISTAAFKGTRVKDRNKTELNRNDITTLLVFMFDIV